MALVAQERVARSRVGVIALYPKTFCGFSYWSKVTTSESKDRRRSQRYLLTLGCDVVRIRRDAVQLQGRTRNLSAKGAYFVRGSGHNKYGGYTEDSDEYQDVMDRLMVKWETARGLVPKPELREAARKTNVGVIAFGSSHGAVTEALDRLAEQGVHADYLRLKAFPFTDEVEDFIASHDTIFVVEQNRDAQLCTLLTAELDIQSRKLVPVLHYDGFPISSGYITRCLQDAMREESVA